MKPENGISIEFLEAIDKGIDRSDEPLTFPRPAPNHPTRFVAFATFAKWGDYILGFEVDEAIPFTVRTKLNRARKLYLLGWIDADLTKAGELALLVALELALKDRYGAAVRQPNDQIPFPVDYPRR